MGIMASFLGQDFLENKISEHRSAAERAFQRIEDSSKMCQLLNPPQIEGGFKRFLLERESYIYHKCCQAELEYAAGKDCLQVCEIFKDAASVWLPAVKEMDFENPIICEHLAYGSKVKSYVNYYNAEVLPGPKNYPGYKKVRYEMMRRPRKSTTQLALESAIISGSWDLANDMAGRYKIEKPSGSNDTLGILISLINDDTNLAHRCMQSFTGKHTRINAFTPEREELLRGLLDNDLKLFTEGVRKTTIRHKGMWVVKKWNKEHKSKKPWKMKKYKTFEDKLEDVKKGLVEFGWVLNRFSLTYSCIAAQKGLINKSLADSNIWSEWVPFAFVERYI